MSHEGSHYNGNRVEALAHLAGAETYSQLNQKFKLQADTSFSMEMLSGIMNADNWKENTGDVDHWTLMANGDLVEDEDGWLRDENGNFIRDKNGNKIGAGGIETGLLNILFGEKQSDGSIKNQGKNYTEFTDEQIAIAQGLMYGAGFTNDGKENPRDVKWNQDENSGNSIKADLIADAAGNTVATQVFMNIFDNLTNGMIDNTSLRYAALQAYSREDYAATTGDWGAFGSYVNVAYDSSADYWRVLANGDLYDDGLDDRVSFEDGRETIYYSKRSKQGTLEKFLGLDAGTGYSLLLKDAGYSWTQSTGWVVDENNPDRVISYENIKNLINDGTVINNYYNEFTPEIIRYNSKIKEVNDKYGYPQERQELKEKQAAVIANPNYQQGSQGPFGFLEATSKTTWCNMATQEVTFETSYNLSMALRNENDLYCVNTNANAMYDNLMKAALDPNSSIVEITPQQAQALANMGYTVAGTWKNSNPDLSGHIATVEAGHEYDPETGPYFGNVGTSRYTGTGQKAIDAFGRYNYQSIKYYYDKEQFKNRRWY